ncbi:MAG: NAD(+)/NADH kinase [Oscillospiraceae bacterium]|jgi:NAD+ kinase|nr:NAD(+)/NADH kinase [Oscillospiraceae bacterium]
MMGSRPVKNVMLCPNKRRDGDMSATKRVAEMARACGAEPYILPLTDEDGREMRARSPEFAEALRKAELIIAFGGDGTVLRAAKLAVGTGIPLLGINMGGKGFLAELEIGQLDAVPQILSGGFEREKRLTLDVELRREGSAAVREIAINDAVLNGGGKVVDLSIYGDGHKISHFTGDGVVIATPTGSTAYSMAAGGPIVEPTAKNIIITPICAHVLEAKPYVLVADRRVTVEVGAGKKNPVFFTVDGKDKRRVKSGDGVSVRKSGKDLCFARIAGRSFYKRVSEKLGEAN